MTFQDVALGEICTMVKGVYPTLKTEPGEYPLVVTAEYRRSADSYQLEGPAVCIPLISSTGHGDAALHRVHYQEGKFALANLLVALLPKRPDVYDSKYLYHLLMRKKDDLLVPLMLGTANVSLKQKDIAKVVISLPPLSEQRRIVARIEELAGKVEEARRLRREAVKEAESLLNSEELKIWSEQTLVNAPLLSELTTFLARGRQSKQGASEHRLIKTQHVQMGKYVKSDMTLAPEVAEKVRSEAKVRDQDILIACSAAGCLGRVAYYTDDVGEASTDTHVAIARARTEVISSKYMYKYLKSAQGQIQLRSRERGDWQREKVGFRLTELNLADLKRVPVPLPSLDEQNDIVTYLEELESKATELSTLQAETDTELEAMILSILDRAFAGKL